MRPVDWTFVLVALVGASLVAVGSNPLTAQEPTCFGQAATVMVAMGVPTVGTDGNDVIIGTDGPDDIRGGGGDDLICGRAGADVIRGNAGNDQIRAGRGNDRVFGGAGRDLIVGGRGRDALFGNSGADTIRGNRGHDEIWGGRGHDTILGGSGDDTLRGNQAGDVIDGGSGHDVISGGKADDVLSGRAGHDVVLGKTGADDLDGGEGWDNCQGGQGRDRKASCEANQSVGAADWSDPTRAVDLGRGWRVEVCGINGFLCVFRNNAWWGSLAFLSFPASDVVGFDPAADDARNLRAFAAESLRSACEDDREPGGCTYELIGPRKFDFGGLSGLRYALTRTAGDGPPAEYLLRYIAISGDDLVMVAASSYREEGWTVETLMRARPIISVILKASPLPAPTGSVTGQVLAGPTCPVERPGDPACEPAPVRGVVQFAQNDGQNANVVASFKTDESGVFFGEVEEGIYTVTVDVGDRPFPRCEPVEVQVVADTELVADIACDTGIR